MMSMKYDKTVSILLPLYKSKVEWLSGAISSIQNQSYGNIKIYLLDDQVGEEGNEYIKKVKVEDERVEIIKNDRNRGLTYTLNNALKIVDTEFIVRMDDDDYSIQNRIEEQLRFFEENPAVDALGSNAIAIEEDGSEHGLLKKNIPLTPSSIKTHSLFECSMIHPSMMMRRTKILSVGGYPEVKYAEDYALWMRMLFSGNCIFANLEAPFIKYRKRRSNRNSYLEEQRKSTLEIKEKVLESLGISRRYAYLLERKGEFGYTSSEVREDAYKLFESLRNIDNIDEKYLIKLLNKRSMKRVYKENKGFRKVFESIKYSLGFYNI